MKVLSEKYLWMPIVQVEAKPDRIIGVTGLSSRSVSDEIIMPP